MRATITLLASTALLALGVSAQGQIAALESASSYCFFLPPSPGGDIAANEDSAIAFCNQANSNAPGAKIFPDGFVLSAHWATGDGWVQITGQIDPSKYSLSPCDQGGQYDIRAPVGASCAGYGYFVNVIEPYDGVYGMRCCTNKGDCNVSQSTYGVRVIFGSQYDFSGPRADGPVPGADQCGGNTTTTTTTGATTSPTTTALPSSTSANGTTTIAQTSTTTVHASSSSASATPTANSTTTTPNSTSAASNNKIAMAATALLACVAGVLIA
ncbi:hypothetical protein BGZ80_010508 [Entomortierella chlamydospora]|uniref:Uncharacterized protein n=1 Tax=Entomortierella chlamydospora TaxID=101097 RepID=A0A9P6N2R0_9FUNG|nr:hypothetical protein BGZ79_002927 [Entomortierella chlamydospora]KAG0023047.1 hypothetical protein BGZ80_010508 [Entomortierella chlamydospora]